MPPKVRRGAKTKQSLCEIKDVTHGYGDGVDATLFENARFEVRIGEKIGIVGRNGTGKSTLLRLLMGEEKPSVEQGKVYPADPKTSRFFTQHQADLLPFDKSAIQVVKEANRVNMDENDILELMKKFRFKNDRLQILCGDLSGGEKARLAIVRMMLSPAQLLILDEPTNHLDVAMKETLELSLREFPGGVVVVSHDRWFLSQTCTEIYAIEDKEVKHYEGDFRYYLDNNDAIRKKVEKHYMKGSDGIGRVPDSLDDLKRKNRGRIKKNTQFMEKRAEAISEAYGRKVVGGRVVTKKYSVFS
jgi:ATP-binding cassette subfamily F protein 3